MDRQGLRSRLADALRELRGEPSPARAARALERQLDYQRAKAAALVARRDVVERDLTKRASRLRARLVEHLPPGPLRIVEVGSGAHGHVFFMGEPSAVGVDPLAEEYRALFPWQSAVRTVAADGARLPFPDASFDLVISDNVIDHAGDPAGIVAELARVLAPGGLLYLTVHVHHRLYDVASRVHGAWRALGIPLEIGPFADHTVHLTIDTARSPFARPDLEIVSSGVVGRDASVRRGAAIRALTRALPKNMLFEVIARRGRTSSGGDVARAPSNVGP